MSESGAHAAWRWPEGSGQTPERPSSQEAWGIGKSHLVDKWSRGRPPARAAGISHETPLHAERLQGDGIIQAADERIGAAADDERRIGGNAAIMSGQGAAGEVA